MKFTKTLKKPLLIITGIVLFPVLMVSMFFTRADLVDGITGDKIKQVKPGMTLEQVISILGKPYQIHILRGVHDGICKSTKFRDINISTESNVPLIVDELYRDTTYCCAENKRDSARTSLILTYSRPVFFAQYYPMLWVHLDEEMKVYNVFAKRYEGFLLSADPVIYSTSWGRDSVTLERKHEKIVMSIDETLFDNCFN